MNGLRFTSGSRVLRRRPVRIIDAVDDVPTTLWKLRRAGLEVACQVRLVPYGIEVDIAHGGRVVVTRSFETDEEALRWADEKRVAREAQGWQSAPNTSPKKERNRVRPA